MTEGPILSAVIVYSIPIVIGGIIQMLFNSADLAVVGNFSQSKTAAAAAVGATGPIFNLIVNLFMGMSVGVNIILAHSIGAGDGEKTERIVHTAVLSSVILGAVVSVIGVSVSRFAMSATNCPEAAYEMAVQYLIIYFLGAPGILLYNFGAAILRTKGDTKRPLYFLIIAGVLNIILNLIFVIVFKMEAAGVALATTLTQYLAAFLTLRCLMSQTDETRVDLKRLRICRKEMTEIIIHGLPNGLANVMYSIANIQIMSALNAYDISAINGSAASANLETIMASAVGASNSAAVAFVGQNIGAKKSDRILRSMFSCMFLSVSFSVICGNLMYIFGAPLIRLFNSSDELVIKYGLIRAGIMLRTYFLYGFSGTLNATLQAFGHSTAVLINSVLSICGLRTLWMQFLYPQHKTIETLFWCYPVSMALVTVVDIFMLIIVYRNYIKQIKKEKNEQAD